MDDGIKDLSDSEIYLSSFYFTITSFSTVGYGDVSANNNYERIFCIFIMVVGVTAFMSAAVEMADVAALLLLAVVVLVKIGTSCVVVAVVRLVFILSHYETRGRSDKQCNNKRNLKG